MTTSRMRATLRSRLTVALRERDRAAAGTLRAAISRLENAEAVKTSGELAPTTSSHIAGAAYGLGGAEAQRRHLTDADERALVEEEIRGLREAEQAFGRAGAGDRATEARQAAALLADVVTSARHPVE